MFAADHCKSVSELEIYIVDIYLAWTPWNQLKKSSDFTWDGDGGLFVVVV